MAEIRRGHEGGSERLPWLEPVEDEDAYPDTGGSGRLALLGVLALVAVGVVVAGVMLVRHWTAGRADIGQIIRAPDGPYKERPVHPGGLRLQGSGVVAEHTGTGTDIDAPLDLASLPEQPIAGAGSPQAAAAPAPAPAATQPQQAAAPAAQPVAKPQTVPTSAPKVAPVAAPAAKAPAPASAPMPVREAAAPAAPVVMSGASGTVQLGAFSTQAKANAAWKTLSGRFHALDGMTMAISQVTSGDATLYRLRASGPSASRVCAALKVAGESCAVVG